MFFLCLYLFHIKAVCEETGIFLIMVIFKKLFMFFSCYPLFYVLLALCFCHYVSVASSAS